MREKTRTEQVERTLKTMINAIETVDKRCISDSELNCFNLSCIRDVLAEICLSLAVICDNINYEKHKFGD